MHPINPSRRRDERGVIGILFAFCLVLLLGMASFAIDIGSARVTRAELQNVGDAGTLAASRELALIYKALPSTTNNKKYQLTSTDQNRIYNSAYGIAVKNKAATVNIEVRPEDLVYGTFDIATGEITPTMTGVRAVSLVARRDATANGVLPTTLARVIGINEMSVRAQAAAGLTALGGLPAGEGEIPVGISSYWFENNQCGPNSTIKFLPTGTMDGCAGWHSFDESPANAARLGNILNGLEQGTYSSPETTAGETSFNFIGGAVASRFNDMKDLYDSKKDVNGDWDVLIPVYQSADCSNPSGSIVIIGFARARVYSVQTAPANTILANVECGVVDIGTGNGPNDYGTLYSSPSMIQ